MIASMTGFARRELAGSWGTLTCELRSVNHRYLEPGFRLPEELRPLESDLRQLLSKNLKRGKVDCTVHLRSMQAAERELRVDEAALARVAAAINLVARTVPGSTVDAVEILRWPGVIETGTQDSDALLGAGRTLFQQTLDELRNAPAQAAPGDSSNNVAGAGALVQVRARLPEIQTRVRTRLHEGGGLLATVDRDRVGRNRAATSAPRQIAENSTVPGTSETRRVTGGEAAAAPRFPHAGTQSRGNTLASKSRDLDTTRLTVDMSADPSKCRVGTERRMSAAAARRRCVRHRCPPRKPAWSMK
jgi:uncharacterized protein (TIGR00255 family)